MAPNDQTSTAPVSQNHKPTNTLELLPFLFLYFKGCGLILVVWLLGYLGFSALWGMVLLFMYLGNMEYKKIKEAKKKFAQQAANDEKKAILARTEELPSWVFFPDVERAEWLNTIIKQLWPNVGTYVEDLLRNTVQPRVQESLPASLKSFKFVTIDLGDIPPRIGGVKVYKNVKRDEIIMDLELFYASDSNIKVSIRGLNAGIKDLQIHGTLRIVMRPLVNIIPLIGGMNVFFLNTPAIDFDLTDLANALDFPGLSDTIRGIVEEQVSYFMVLPNKIPIQLAENIDITKLRYPVPHGVLRIHAIGANHLKRADFKLVGKGKSDPYCKIYIGAQVFKTKVVQNTITPEWNQYFEAIVDQRFGQYMEVEVMDEDPGDDDDLGTVSVDLQTVASQGQMDSWLPLEGVDTGMVHLNLLWLYLSPDANDLEKVLKENYASEQTINDRDHLSSAILFINLDSAQNLPRAKKGMAEPSPYVVMNIGNINKKSTTKPGTINPRWEENFQFLIQNPYLQEVMFQVRDLKRDKKQVKNVVTDSKNDKNLGSVVFSLKELLDAKNLTINRPFTLLASGPETRLNIRISLRILTSTAPLQPVNVEEPSPPVTPVKTSSTPPTTPDDAEKQAAPSVPDPGTSVDPPKQRVSDVPVIAASERSEPPASAEEEETGMSMMETEMSIPMPAAAAGDSSNGQLRKRTVTTASESGDAGLGRIQITLRYSMPRNRLVVVVHKCINLIPCDNDNLADPYVRMYMLPDKSSGSKRKTQIVKNNLNPVFDETFDWAVSQADLSQRVVEILVKNSVGMFSKGRKQMGLVMIDFSQIDLTMPKTEWFDLQPSDK